eukprot:TRINITY_DN2289_c7_g1_i1.p1 TRINITY_DN2289_c7_g1~~TRINITY_DN2289_c7_g1_i1.p1  ORF type:complete len:888 (+),score=276.90 TRINITY_DN2289_c7_g1_i1:79-2742(+)
MALSDPPPPRAPLVEHARRTRIGGGHTTAQDAHSHPYKWTEGSPRRRRPDPPAGGRGSRQQPAHSLRAAPLPGVAAVAAVQGGATLWTLDHDGGLSVRAGQGGAAVRSPRPDGASTAVTAIAADDVHVWAGLDDGSVEVYDHLVMACISANRNSKASGAVTQIRCSADGAVSASASWRTVSRWAGEAEGYELMAEHRLPASPESVMRGGCCAFVGTGAGLLHMLCWDTLEEHVAWTSPHAPCAVSSLSLVDGMLASAGTDGTVCLWEEAAAAQLRQQQLALPLSPQHRPHAAPTLLAKVTAGAGAVRGLHADQRSRQLWALCADGAIQRYHVSHRGLFPAGDPVHTGAPAAAWSLTTVRDGVHVWALSSASVVSCWFSEWACGAEEMREALGQLHAIADQDAEEASKWQGLVQRLEEWDARRRSTVADVLARCTGDGLRAACLRRWGDWLALVAKRRRLQTLAACLGRCTAGGLLKVYWTRLGQFAEAAARSRKTRAAGALLMSSTRNGLKRVYWAKLEAFRQARKAEERRRDIVDFLLRVSSSGLRAVTWRKLWRFRTIARAWSARQRVAARIMRSTETGQLRLRFFSWLQFARRAARDRRQLELGTAFLPRMQHAALRRKYLHKAVRWAGQSHWRQLRGPVAEQLRSVMSRSVLTVYFRIWRSWSVRAPLRRAQAEVQAVERRLLGLREQAEAQRSCPIRARIRELELELGDEGPERGRLQELIGRLEPENRRMQESIEKGEKLLEGGISGAMNRLKEVALNFCGDHEHINKIERRLAGKGESLEKIFREAHIEIKTQVVQCSGQPELPVTAEWPVRAIIGKIPGFQLRRIHTAIKTMVIAFDHMTKLRLELMETDDEIVLNGENLILLYKAAEQAAGPRQHSPR